MHIPDGFLDPKTILLCYGISVGWIAVALKRTKGKLGEKMVPLMGVMGAFIFAAQMFNFPIAGGTSGHLLGSFLAALLLGVWEGSTVMAAVVIIQCLVFQDGGLLSLGANLLNIAILGAISGLWIVKLSSLTSLSKKMFLFACGTGAWLSVVVPAAACAGELGLSGVAPWKTTLVAMTVIHALIGVVEAIITILIIVVIDKIRPDLLRISATTS
ncbi:cobalamin biosynthesis protein CbiM [bacterium (candidate division B38) B3_B38]|nr:MAG: cobalamin biosynthesis protein CbiM [bacterium (candidate division B38) B3_B38]